ncbi:hypothetical protein BMS3Bbin01_02071 [bacterium BMS3Bbin01]|nr:hypothetical protein BMS3Bbin01_02071 [bacterium BMS3Bbin01]
MGEELHRPQRRVAGASNLVKGNADKPIGEILLDTGLLLVGISELWGDDPEAETHAAHRGHTRTHPCAHLPLERAHPLRIERHPQPRILRHEGMKPALGNGPSPWTPRRHQRARTHEASPHLGVDKLSQLVGETRVCIKIIAIEQRQKRCPI